MFFMRTSKQCNDITLGAIAVFIGLGFVVLGSNLSVFPHLTNQSSNFAELCKSLLSIPAGIYIEYLWGVIVTFNCTSTG